MTDVCELCSSYCLFNACIPSVITLPSGDELHPNVTLKRNRYGGPGSSTRRYVRKHMTENAGKEEMLRNEIERHKFMEIFSNATKYRIALKSPARQQSWTIREWFMIISVF